MGAVLLLPQILVGTLGAAGHRSAAGGSPITSLLGDTSCAAQPLMVVSPSGTSPAPSRMQWTPCTEGRARCSPWVGAAAGTSALSLRAATLVASLCPLARVSISLLTKPLFPALGTPLLTVMAHSCGVNSLHIHRTPEGPYLVASGSDDGSIHVCLLEVSLGEGTAGTCLRVLERVARPCAHAAHVTGIRVLRPDLLLSASVDQRLTLWRRGPGGLDMLSTTFFHVPDLAELDCWEVMEAGGVLSYCCVLCGQGLEVLRGTCPPEPPPLEAPQ